MSAPLEAGADERHGTDVLVVSLGSTAGWQAADAELVAGLRACGLDVALVAARRPRPVRTLMLTDLLWALSARRAARAAIAECAPRAIIYCTSTAAHFWPRPGAIRFDTPAQSNRPGRHGLWQRPLERRRLRAAPLLLPMSDGGLEECAPAFPGIAPSMLRERLAGRHLVLPMPVEPSARGGGEASGERQIAAIAYGANPHKKGIDRVLEAFARARRGDEELLLAGCDRSELRAAGIGGDEQLRGVRLLGKLPREEYRAHLRRARVFICAPRHEDYGIAQLEALADGCMLVSSRAGGPYVAYGIAERIDPRLLGEDLAGALRTALDDPLADYAARAAAELRPFSRRSVDRLIAEQLRPALQSCAIEPGSVRR